MRKNGFISKVKSKNQKKLYLLLIGLALLAIIFGLLFIFMISKDNKDFLSTNYIKYFEDTNGSIALLFKTIFNYFIYIIVIWILGISIIGIPIVLFIFLFKNFLFGFSISSIINSFGFKGILISLIDLFPHKFLFLIVMLLISFYSLSFSIKLIRHLFLKKPINFREAMNKYFKILVISLSVSIFISLYEVFISSYLIKLI